MRLRDDVHATGETRMNPKKKSVFNKDEKNIEPTYEEQQASKKRERLLVPLSLYYLKDLAIEFVNGKNFPDSLLSAFAMVSIAIAFPFYPVPILLLLTAAVFILSRLHPFAGLMALLFLTFPMFVYQAPLLAWLYLFFVSAALYFGFKHSNTITVAYSLMVIPFSYLGLALEIPVFIMGILYLGLKRGVIMTVLALVFIQMISGLTGIHSLAPISYNPQGFQSAIGNPSFLALMTPSSKATTLQGFAGALQSSFSRFFSFSLAGNIINAIYASAAAFMYGIEYTFIQIVVWLIVVFTISRYVVKSRSPYKGTGASFFAVAILAAYAGLNYVTGFKFNPAMLVGFLITPLIIFVLEVNDVNIVRALEVMKKDFLGKFGEGFEELTAGTHETLKEIANYTETKKELSEAILEPIEHKEMVGAYNIKPAKGILLFGPPGTGKTMMMRALSNEIRAKFFYVKTSAILSPHSGESSALLSNIFVMVRKNAPAVLFFDEIDGIATKREAQSETSSRQLLSVLLSEMDGFQKLEGVVVVGSTNVPHLLDPSIMRPGRFDKIIYIPLPDRAARVEVFKHYSKKYPMVSEIDFEKLALLTERFSNADIANVYSEAARQVADEALGKSKILKIDTDDLTKVIKAIKPSTSISQLAEYDKFKTDYGRRLLTENKEKEKDSVSVDDVVGLSEAKKTLYEAMEIPILHPSLAKEYDIKGISGILLFGPPGTGKTMMMKAVSSEIGEYKMFSISGSDLVKEGYEKATATINELFNRARENIPSVIVIDEIDSLIPKRDSNASFDVRITAEFLREFDTIKEAGGVLIVGTTNRPDQIDPAMLRPGRLSKLVFVGPPGKAERSIMFQNCLKKVLCEGLDFGKLAEMTQGYTGADIEGICNDAKTQALEQRLNGSERSPVTMNMLTAIIKGKKPSAPESSMGRYQTFMYLH